ncbi:MAG: LuxR C-terminal-related transcriptional regulator [Actinomycetota bacterium]
MRQPKERAPVESPRSPSGVVTFLLTDVAGSTQLWESDRNAMARAIARHYEIIDEEVAKNGGVRPVEQGEGDSAVAAFALASDAALAAIRIQQTMEAEAWPDGSAIRIRIALHTGEVITRDDGNYAGPTLNRCARLRAIGHGGQTLLSRTTADLVRDDLPPDVALIDLGEHPLRSLTRPEHVFQIDGPGLASGFPPLLSARARPSPLPEQITTFIGREAEVQEVADLLTQTRLLTLVGAGGCGKTRLAIEVAGLVTDRYTDGVVWVDLAALTDPGLVPSSVATALNLREALFYDPVDTVASYLERRNVLILLDNCEHLANACATFADRILRKCPEVTFLATSREALGVDAETSWRVPSLAIPQPGGDDPEQAEAVRLFIDRARKARPRIELTPETVEAIASICRRLDGIPLAVELAAARVRTMSPSQIAKGIGERFSLLGGGSRTALARQRTLEASVDWSYALLTEPERILFRRLAIFAGGFTLEAAERVCSDAILDEFAVMDVLSRLVDRSLVQVEETDDGPRYRFLETVRVYARQKLADSDDATAIRDRHLAFFIELAERAQKGLITSAMLEWAERLERDHDNVRVAIDWSLESEQTDSALRFLIALGLFWLYANHLPEGSRRIDPILALEGGEPLMRARALASAAGAAIFALDDPSKVHRFADPALALGEEIGDPWTIGRASAFSGFAALFRSVASGREPIARAIAAATEAEDVAALAVAMPARILVETFLCERDRALAASRRSVDWARGTEHPDFIAECLLASGIRATWWGEFELAESLLDESISTARAIDNHFPLSVALAMRGYTQTLQGRYDDARADLREAMTIAEPEGLIAVFSVGNVFLARNAFAEGDLETAAALSEQGLAITRAIDWTVILAIALADGSLIKAAQGDLVGARAMAAEALSMARENGFANIVGHASFALAQISQREGSLDDAENTLHDALGVLSERHLILEIVVALEHIATIACLKESFLESARLLGAPQGVRDLIGYPRPPISREDFESALESSRRELGDEVVAEAFDEGRALSLDEAVAYATRARGERKRPSHGWSSLTPTELDVVRLVREGLTNPQIAQRMFISKNTVMTHVSHIFTKLGLKTRSELASEATRREI